MAVWLENPFSNAILVKVIKNERLRHLLFLPLRQAETWNSTATVPRSLLYYYLTEREIFHFSEKETLTT